MDFDLINLVYSFLSFLGKNDHLCSSLFILFDFYYRLKDVSNDSKPLDGFSPIR